MVNIASIQKFSIHDGDGIRTTVFFKGCPLSCKWCHNPETQSYHKQLLIHYDRCVKCGKCGEFCNKPCDYCYECTDVCMQNAREFIGKDLSPLKLVSELKKDLQIYEVSGGGVTLSGGEVMAMEINYIEEVMSMLNDEGISVNIDTCGYAPFENFEKIIPYTDVFLYDVKIINPEKHKEFTGVNNKLILDNLIKLNSKKAVTEIRIPLIKGFNADKESMFEVANFLSENNIDAKQVCLLPYHSAGNIKYSKLQLESSSFACPTKADIDGYKKIFLDNGFTVKVGG